VATILAVTVGGACQPVIAAITDYRPSFVYFLASGGARGSKTTVDGAGTPCSERVGDNSVGKPSIVKQTGLADNGYTIRELDEPDSLQDCYAVARAALSEAAMRFPNHQYVADYTGGTKTMSVALVMAALEANWNLSLVKGARTDLIKVVDGTEVAGLVNSWEVRARQRMEEARLLFNGYHYAAAEQSLEAVLRANPLSTTLQAIIRKWIGLARCFDAWDRFDHARALAILTPFQAECVPNFRFLKRLTGEDKNCSGYEPMYDLILNAERRAEQGRFDDAVARLYRAVELLAQTRLRQRQPSLDSSDLNTSLLPEELRAVYERLRDVGDSKIKLGLRQDYELLSALGDVAGDAYHQHRNPLNNALKARNVSILAHGDRPLHRQDYENLHSIVKELTASISAAHKLTVDAPQFPFLRDDSLVQQ
jgi:hypothetical protein